MRRILSGVDGILLLAAAAAVAALAAAAILIWRLRNERARLLAENAALRAALAREESVARTDTLTALGNATAFQEAYTRSVAMWRRAKQPLAVGCIELDNFETITETHGRAVGDEMLKTMASAIAEVLRASDMAARISDEEFAVLLHQCSPDAASRIGERIIQRVGTVTQAFPELALGVSIGVACFEVPPSAADQALKEADRALFVARAKGGNQIEIALPELRAVPRT